MATSPATKARLFLEAAREHERAGDAAAALRDAAAAHAAVGDGLARLALERAEIESGAAARLADGLLARARSTEDPRERREAYERLADLDATGREDAASALLWHRSILEEQPDYTPSLRHVEHALLSDGRVDELEPVSAAIARALVDAGGHERRGGGARAARRAPPGARARGRVGAHATAGGARGVPPRAVVVGAPRAQRARARRAGTTRGHRSVVAGAGRAHDAIAGDRRAGSPRGRSGIMRAGDLLRARARSSSERRRRIPGTSSPGASWPR